MKKQNMLVLCIAIVLIAAVFALAAFTSQTRTIPQNAPSVGITETAADQEQQAAPVQTTKPEDDGSAETNQNKSSVTDVQQMEAYLVMSVSGTLYEPLPLTDEGTFTIKQNETTTNTVHVTPTSVWMEHSSCDNQDCVTQGTVSLENMETRVLPNMIICLPNEVVLELHTAETLASTYALTQSSRP